MNGCGLTGAQQCTIHLFATLSNLIIAGHSQRQERLLCCSGFPCNFFTTRQLLTNEFQYKNLLRKYKGPKCQPCIHRRSLAYILSARHSTGSCHILYQIRAPKNIGYRNRTLTLGNQSSSQSLALLHSPMVS